ncbi:glycosyltransferase [Luteolibacter yonseiensis]|uniref:Glycosyltransferase n=2 Tax=Luteolibacter yonseiensis TaxID=1144680 RepID=A0A934V952_9BACT|nr:glycosyltransferase [Luteolibacter yonseiensis]MBK1817957.1 glycosyltransferase [Luteolibacter yonseiensis]
MRPFPQAISVVMRSFNEAWAIGDTIRELFAQDFDGEIELIVIDSGSSDGSIGIIKETGRAKLIQIPLGTYVPGVVLNQGAREAKHDWIVYLNADATPVGKNWLTSLIQPCLADPKFGAGFSRQIPRPDCKAVFAHDYDRCFGPERESKNWDHFFSMVSSITHRSVLDEHPFREDLQYAEDDEWTRRLAAAGFSIPYAIDSVVTHSHNYTVSQSYKRLFGDAKAMSAAGTAPPEKNLVLGWLADSLRDAKWCLKNHRLGGLPFATAVRLAQRLGRRDGNRAGRQVFQRSQS